MAADAMKNKHLKFPLLNAVAERHARGVITEGARVMRLITGFEPFTTGQGLVLEHNPTADIARNVARATPDIHCAVLPVSYRRTRDALHEAWVTAKTQVWLGLGYAPHRTTLDVEMVALNLEHAESGDNDGDAPTMRSIIVEAPLAYRWPVESDRLLHTLENHGCPGRINLHAGAFLCNQTFFLGCHAQAQGQLTFAGFIHVPPMSNYSALENALTQFLLDTAVST